jgi:hypothetical protein
MTATLIANATENSGNYALQTKAVRKALIALSIAVFAIVAAILVSRRLAGALIEPLPSMALVSIGVMSIGVVCIIRILTTQVALNWFISAILLLLALAVSLPGSSWLGLIALWLGVAGEEIWAWRAQRSKPRSQLDIAWRHTAEDIPQSKYVRPLTQAPVFSSTPALPIQSVVEPTEAWNDSTATQHLKYSRTTDGVMSVEGWLRAEFAAGQRTATIHAAFCPAFTHTPNVECEPLDGSDCEIRPMLTLPWGIRWDIKLNRAAKQTSSVVLGFFATDAENT